MHATIRYPLLCNGGVNTVLSVGSVPRLYSESLFVAGEIRELELGVQKLQEYRRVARRELGRVFGIGKKGI
jgi:hypothetical protein